MKFEDVVCKSTDSHIGAAAVTILDSQTAGQWLLGLEGRRNNQCVGVEFQFCEVRAFLAWRRMAQ